MLQWVAPADVAAPSLGPCPLPNSRLQAVSPPDPIWRKQKHFHFHVLITAGNFWIVALGFVLKIVFQVFVASTISLSQSFEVWTADGCSEGQGWRDLKDSEPNSVGPMAFRKTNIINCCLRKQNKVWLKKSLWTVGFWSTVSFFNLQEKQAKMKHFLKQKSTNKIKWAANLLKAFLSPKNALDLNTGFINCQYFTY